MAFEMPLFSKLKVFFSLNIHFYDPVPPAPISVSLTTSQVSVSFAF